MQIADEHGAREWLRSWGAKAFTNGRIERVIASQRMCASLCGDRLCATRDGHLRAVEFLEGERARHLNEGNEG